MSTYDESQHERGRDGKYAEMAGGAPESALTAPAEATADSQFRDPRPYLNPNNRERSSFPHSVSVYQPRSRAEFDGDEALFWRSQEAGAQTDTSPDPEARAAAARVHQFITHWVENPVNGDSIYRTAWMEDGPDGKRIPVESSITVADLRTLINAATR